MKKRLLLAVVFGACVLAGAEKSDYTPEYPYNGSGRYILSPPAALAPRINGPSVFGVRPGSPFLFTIPATGERPLEFSVESLPKGLSVDSATGIISGRIASKAMKDYGVTFRAENAQGKDAKSFTIKVGEEICLTPPLGWNYWNCWARNSTQEKILASARAMVSKGLKDYGFTYVNLDGYWQGDTRGGKYSALEPDYKRYPDIKAMFDEIHELGLKGGIYSTPWVTSYAKGIGGTSDTPDGAWDPSMVDPKGTKLADSKWRRVGEYSFAESDVKQWVEWGVDYLKYDWQPVDTENIVEMADVLRASGRDIVYSISNNAKFDVVEVCKTRVNCWRTGVDLKDYWDDAPKGWSIIQTWDRQRYWLENGYRGGPGHFPDPDMLVVGDLTSSTVGPKLAPTNLTPDEQYSHVTLWVLWASPILIGCPIENMDSFTLNLFRNAELIAVHQDSTATPGMTVYNEGGHEIIVKDLEGGAKAVGLFNKNETEEVVTFDWDMAGLKGAKQIRDVWRNKDIGSFKGSFSATVRPHGTVLIQLK